MNKLWEMLESSVGKRLTLVIFIFTLGIISMRSIPKFLVTTDMFVADKNEIYAAMNSGDIINKLEIINIQLDDARTEKMKMQNFIDIQQSGQCSDSQKMRIEELNNRIQKLEIQRDELYRQFQNLKQKGD